MSLYYSLEPIRSVSYLVQAHKPAKEVPGHEEGYEKSSSAQPRAEIEPMEALLVTQIPQGEQWVYEPGVSLKKPVKSISKEQRQLTVRNAKQRKLGRRLGDACCKSPFGVNPPCVGSAAFS